MNRPETSFTQRQRVKKQACRNYLQDVYNGMPTRELSPGEDLEMWNALLENPEYPQVLLVEGIVALLSHQLSEEVNHRLTRRSLDLRHIRVPRGLLTQKNLSSEDTVLTIKRCLRDDVFLGDILLSGKCTAEELRRLQVLHHLWGWNDYEGFLELYYQIEALGTARQEILFVLLENIPTHTVIPTRHERLLDALEAAQVL